jgi:hypothetical protein
MKPAVGQNIFLTISTIRYLYGQKFPKTAAKREVMERSIDFGPGLIPMPAGPRRRSLRVHD